MKLNPQKRELSGLLLIFTVSVVVNILHQDLRYFSYVGKLLSRSALGCLCSAFPGSDH